MRADQWDPDRELRAAWREQPVPAWDGTAVLLRTAYRAVSPRRSFRTPPRGAVRGRTTIFAVLAASLLGTTAIFAGLEPFLGEREIGGTRVPGSARVIRADAGRTEILHGRVRLILLHDQPTQPTQPSPKSSTEQKQ